jgi:hypothetical protein
MASEGSINIKVGSRGYIVRLVPDTHHSGFRAQLISEGIGVVAEPHGNDKAAAVISLIRELEQTGDGAIAEAIKRAVEKEITGPGSTGATLKILDPGLEADFNRFAKMGGSYEDMAAVLLGDTSYVKKYKMPKWNVPVSMLQEPKVALRHYNLKTPMSKSAQTQRHDELITLTNRILRAVEDLEEAALARYGSHGSLISGAVREHFPAPVKDRLRFLAHGLTMVKDASRLHATLAKSRSPAFNQATSVARTQRRWQIRGIRPDGGKLAFVVLAYDHQEAGKLAKAKAKGGTVTDIVLLD